MKIKNVLLSLACLLCFGQCSTQTWVQGTVRDDTGEPLIGAGVHVKGTTAGTVTDRDGRFSLAVPDSVAVLVISYVGFKQKEVPVPARGEPVTVEMQAASAVLDEVVVSGIRREEKRATSSSVERIRDGSPDRLRATPPPPPPPPVYELALTSKSVPAEGAPEDRSDASTFHAASVSGVPDASAGTLTAGEVHDFSKWELWQDISEEDLAEWRDHWQVFPAERYTLQLTNEAGQSVVDAPVRLLAASGEVVWRGRTDNTGKAELWARFFAGSLEQAGPFRLAADWEGRSFELGAARIFQQGINHRRIPVSCDRPAAVDIAFVVDATGSMSDEIAYLKAELEDVIGRARDTLAQADLRLAAVFYRDKGDEYLTRHSDFSSDISRTVDFIGEQNANGGGDTPEAVDEALRVALSGLSWRPTAVARLLFLVLDAPPHHNPEVMQRLRELTQEAAARGIRIVPVVCSGMDKSGEYLMRALALATNGTYTFLTDDSGVGGSHLEPTTDAYDVEKLNALLARVIYHFAHTSTCEEEWPQAILPAADTTLVTVDLGGEPDGAAGLQFRFYPNPTTGPLTVETDGPVGELFLTDFAGKVLERFRLDGPQLALDLGQYPAGAYHLRYLAGDDRWSGGRVVLVRM